MNRGPAGSMSMERTILFQTEEFEVVSIEWTDQKNPALHNHGWSQCFVLIEEGVFENRLDLGVKVECQLLEKGQVMSTPVGAQHEMRCKTPQGRTLHVYTPKILELGDQNNFRALSLDRLKIDIALSEPTRMDGLKSLLTKIREHSVSTHSPYFMNQLFSGILPQMLLAEDFIARTKTTLATFEASPALSTIELEVVSALCQKIGWNLGESGGVSVPGGSAANFMAIHCARQKVLPGAKKRGARGSVLKVFASVEAHYSFKKACAVLGIGTENLVLVPTDERGRMKAEDLDQLIAQSVAKGELPIMVAATAGTTVLGAFDAITALATVCRKHEVWLHVDAAWGGPALFSKKLQHLVQGLALVDSVSFDAHKLFGASLTSSFFLTKRSDILLEANDVSGGDYLFHSGDAGVDRGKMSWQCGRSADAVSFWTIWKSLGTEGLGDFVDRLLGIREETLNWIRGEPRLRLVSPPDYLNICVRILPPNQTTDPDWSRNVREQLKDHDLAMVNFSRDSFGSFLRLILAHPYLQFDHVRKILTWALEVK